MPGICGFISVILFLRVIGVQEYGKYSLLLSQCNLIVALSYGWLNQAQLRYFSQDRTCNYYYNSQIKSLLFCGIFSLLISLIVSFYNNQSYKIWFVSLITIICIGCFNYIKTYFQAKLLPQKVVFLNTVQSILAISVPLLITLFFGKTSIHLIIGIAFSFLIATLIIIKNNPFGIPSNKNKKNVINLIKRWLYYGSPLSIWFAIGLTLSFLDRFFINYYLNTTELGIYSSLQEILVKSFSLTLFPFTLALHPRIMNLWNNSKIDETIKLMIKSFILIFALGSLILFTVWYLNDLTFLLFSIILPGIDSQSKGLILPLLLAGLLWQLSFITHKMMELKEQTIFMVVSILPSLIINFIGNIYYLPKLGGIATAYTALFSALAYFLITGFHFIYSINKMKLS